MPSLTYRRPSVHTILGSGLTRKPRTAPFGSGVLPAPLARTPRAVFGLPPLPPVTFAVIRPTAAQLAYEAAIEAVAGGRARWLRDAEASRELDRLVDELHAEYEATRLLEGGLL